MKCKQNARNNKDLEGFLKDIRRIFLDNYAEKVVLPQNFVNISFKRAKTQNLGDFS